MFALPYIVRLPCVKIKNNDDKKRQLFLSIKESFSFKYASVEARFWF